MKPIVLILSLIIGLLAINFPISICSQSQSQSQTQNDGASPPPPVMPVHPPTPSCTGFPGSFEWNQCWDNFRQDMQNFAVQMQNFHQSQLSNMTFNQTNDGATSSIFVNGYSIRGQGLNINSNSINGRLNIEVFIGKPENVSVNTTDHQINWDFVYPKNVTKWLIFRAPQTVNMTSISHVIRDEKISIFGPTDDNGSSSSSSSGSFSSNVGFGGFFNNY